MASALDILRAAAAKGQASGGGGSFLTNPLGVASQHVDARMADYQAQKAAADQEAAIGNFFAGLPEGWAAEGARALTAQHDAEAAQQAQRAQAQSAADAVNARYGSDMSWLDPSFQYSPALIGGSNVANTAYANPGDIAAQQAAYTGLMKQANTPLNFTGAGAQEALSTQWAGIAGGQGAPQFLGNGAQQGLSNQWAAVQGGQGAPQFMGGDQQAALMQQLLNVRAPQFGSDAQQQQVYGQAMARAGGQGAPQFMGDQDQRAIMQQLLGQTGSQGLAFDSGAREAEQYGNLQDIIRGGGANAIEMANRQAQRADQESWLRGQREADMQDYAERGLTGSGQELLALSADRQASAGRNSLADLQTASQLEQRRLGAIQSAAGLASNMRGETANEQGLIANRTLSALNQAGTMANAIRGDDTAQKQYLDQAALSALGLAGTQANTMRGQTATEQLGLNAALQNQATSAANIAGQMRSQQYNEGTYLDKRMLGALQAQTDLAQQMRTNTYNEGTYLDKRMLSALGQQTDLANTMRAQQYNEQVAQAANASNALQAAGGLSTSMRNAGFNEANTRASSLDAVNQLNQSAINTARQANTGWLQQGYANTQAARNNQDALRAQLNTQVALGLLSRDQADNIAAANQATMLGTSNANAASGAKAEQRSDLLGAAGASQAAANAVQQQKSQVDTEAFQYMGNFMNMMGQMAMGGAGGGAGGMGGMGAGASASSGSLSQPGTTWGSSGATGAQATGTAYNPQQAGFGQGFWDNLNKSYG